MQKPYYTNSKLTGKKFDIFDTVTIMNPRQAAFYVSSGLDLLDLRISEDRKTKDPVFCYIFKKSDSKPYFDAWCTKKDETIE